MADAVLVWVGMSVALMMCRGGLRRMGPKVRSAWGHGMVLMGTRAASDIGGGIAIASGSEMGAGLPVAASCVWVCVERAVPPSMCSSMESCFVSLTIDRLASSFRMTITEAKDR